MTFCSPESLSLISAPEGVWFKLVLQLHNIDDLQPFKQICANNWVLKVEELCWSLNWGVAGAVAIASSSHDEQPPNYWSSKWHYNFVFQFSLFLKFFYFSQFPPPHSRQPVSAAIEIQFTEVTKPALGKSQLVKLPHQCHRRPHLIDGQSCQQSFFWLD